MTPLIHHQIKKDPTLSYSKNQYIKQNSQLIKMKIFKRKLHQPIENNRIKRNPKKINKKLLRKIWELMQVEDRLGAKFKEKVQIYTLFE